MPRGSTAGSCFTQVEPEQAQFAPGAGLQPCHVSSFQNGPILEHNGGEGRWEGSSSAPLSSVGMPSSLTAASSRCYTAPYGRHPSTHRWPLTPRMSQCSQPLGSVRARFPHVKLFLIASCFSFQWSELWIALKVTFTGCTPLWYTWIS